MTVTERIAHIAEVAKNIIVVLGVPLVGLYIWQYHEQQMANKDAIIDVQKTMLDLKEENRVHAELFAVESMNERFSALKTLYEGQIADVSDSLGNTKALLDSLSSQILEFKGASQDGRWQVHGSYILIPYSDMLRITEYRRIRDEQVANLRLENTAVRLQLNALKARQGDTSKAESN